MKRYICYSAMHVPSGLQYIGVTCQGLKRRKSLHISQARRGDGSVFQLALRKFDEDEFDWKVEGEGNRMGGNSKF